MLTPAYLCHFISTPFKLVSPGLNELAEAAACNVALH